MGLGFCGADSEHHSLRQPVTQPDLSHQQSYRWDEDVLERTRGNAGEGLTLWAAHEYEKMEKEREATA